ncbi:DUF6522 family protein [Alsobacter sp. SYSU M60028]|uniref:DUF6522 family protein n=1 Tax=Alsobacter ponti TaxID=2962936 RepID=A0ABT1L966_9HYPH|nr:DUF6522 family protein [Alsobacter ponti]MCP8937588.1 DUF6522 family protein [Alsobacter ponti]
MSGDVEIPLEWVASAFGLTPEAALEAMRAGRITSVVENGVGEDEGRRRLTFFNGSRRARIVLDAAGRPVQRSSVDFGAADSAMRRAGGPPRR